MTPPPHSEVDEAQIVGNHKAGHPAIDIELESHAKHRMKATISFVYERNDLTTIEFTKSNHGPRTECNT